MIHLDDTKEIYCYFDETKFYRDNIPYLGLACVTIEKQQINDIEKVLLDLKESLVEDQFTGKRKKTKIFHFTDDNTIIKNEILRHLRDAHFRAYIAFAELKEPYWQTYVMLLEKNLYGRLQEKHDYAFRIHYEENSEIKYTQISTKIKVMIDNLKKDYPVISTPIITKITKRNILVTLPDYILGVFRAYSKVNRLEYMKFDFEKLRNKIRLIVDMKKSIYYSRKNPYTINNPNFFDKINNESSGNNDNILQKTFSILISVVKKIFK